MDISVLGILVAFAGGAFGAMFGGLMSFIFVGFICVAGVAATMSGVPGAGIILGVFAFGPSSLFAPHIGFGGGSFAAGYAKSRGYIASGKDIFTALITLRKPDVLCVGGLGGVLGYLFCTVGNAIGVNDVSDVVALSLVLVGLTGKLIFDRTLVGHTPDEVKAAGGRFSVNSPVQWLPYVSSGFEKLLVGGLIGLGASWIALEMMAAGFADIAAFIPFLISIVSLIGFFFGVMIPVSHHITLCASLGTLFSGGNIVWGVTCGIIAAFVADCSARIFYLFGKKLDGVHVDAATMGIVVTSIIAKQFVPRVAGNPALSVIIPLAVLAAAVALGCKDAADMKKVKEAKA